MNTRPTASCELSLSRYFDEIKDIPLLTREDEIDLAQRIRKGDVKARDRLINANLRLVVKIARKYQNCGLPLEDLISEGNVGVTIAAERFDPSFGTKFSTYAPWWIKRSIKMAIGNQKRTIRVPLHVLDQIRQVSKLSRKLAGKLGRQPSTREIAKSAGLTQQQMSHLQQASLSVCSLDLVVGEEGTQPLVALIPDEAAPLPHEEAERSDLCENLRRVLSTLNPREQLVISARFGLGETPPQTLGEVAQNCGITPERIRQIQRAAIQKLRFAFVRQEREALIAHLNTEDALVTEGTERSSDFASNPPEKPGSGGSPNIAAI